MIISDDKVDSSESDVLSISREFLLAPVPVVVLTFENCPGEGRTSKQTYFITSNCPQLFPFPVEYYTLLFCKQVEDRLFKFNIIDSKTDCRRRIQKFQQIMLWNMKPSGETLFNWNTDFLTADLLHTSFRAFLLQQKSSMCHLNLQKVLESNGCLISKKS